MLRAPDRGTLSPPGIACSLLALLLLAAGGCDWDWDERDLSPPTTDAPRIEDHIVLIGDSLLYQSTTPVVDALESKGWQPTFRAMPAAPIAGHPLIDWREAMRTLVSDERPAVVVIELGTNDCNCDSIGDTIDDLMRVVAADRVYWIGVREQAPVPGDPAQINDELEEAARRWTNLEFVALDGALDEERDIGEDRVHFSDEGQRVFADLIANTVGEPESR